MYFGPLEDTFSQPSKHVAHKGTNKRMGKGKADDGKGPLETTPSHSATQPETGKYEKKPLQIDKHLYIIYIGTYGVAVHQSLPCAHPCGCLISRAKVTTLLRHTSHQHVIFSKHPILRLIIRQIEGNHEKVRSNRKNSSDNTPCMFI